MQGVFFSFTSSLQSAGMVFLKGIRDVNLQRQWALSLRGEGGKRNKRRRGEEGKLWHRLNADCLSALLSVSFYLEETIEAVSPGCQKLKEKHKCLYTGGQKQTNNNNNKKHLTL